MTAPAEKPDKPTKSKVKPEPEYVVAWRKLIDATLHPMSLLSRWHAERDERDKLKVPIALRLDLLQQIEVEPLRQPTSATGDKTSRPQLTTTTTASTSATNKG
jgi:hypothetical protein